MKMIKPAALEIGDTIGIVSPSGPILFKKDYVMNGIKILQEMGFKTKLGKNALKENGYMAGTDEERKNDLMEMFEDKKIKAIFTTRGGDVASRLLDILDYNAIRKNPKILMGLSDITVLLNAINKKTGLVTFHGPLVAWGVNCSFWRLKSMESYSKGYMLKTLTVKKPVGNIKPVAKRIAIKEGKTEGILIGGNLDCIEKLSGTKYEPDFRKKIFFWEEFREYVEDMDRDLTHLRLHGIFDKINGMIIGHLEGYLSKGEKYKRFEKMIKEVTKEYDFPILKAEEFGHTLKNAIIPVGIKARIDNTKFEIIESAVR